MKASSLASTPTNPSDPKSPAADRDAAQQDGFLREVDEALREEEVMNLIRRWGRPVGAAIAVGLLALGGYLWWDNSTKQEAAARAERMAVAIDQLQAGSLDPAAKELAQLANEGGDGGRASAALALAGIALQQGKTDAAAAKFAAIAADEKVPQPYRDLATVREVSIRYDKMKPEEVISRLKALAVPGNPWFGSAGELVGMAYLEQGKADQAGRLFAQIGSDKDTPDSLRERMRQMAGELGFESTPLPGEKGPAQ